MVNDDLDPSWAQDPPSSSTYLEHSTTALQTLPSMQENDLMERSRESNALIL